MTTRTRILLSLTPAAVAELRAASERLGISASAVVELLVRRHGAAVRIDPRLLPPDHRGRVGAGRRKKSGKSAHRP